MSETTSNRRPLHMTWPVAIIASIAVENPQWGLMPCPLDGVQFRFHTMLRQEISYDDRGVMDGVKAVVACDRTPDGPKPPEKRFGLGISRTPAPGFRLGFVDGQREDKVLITLTDLRTQRQVFGMWFDESDYKGQQYHVGGVLLASHSPDEAWEKGQIAEVSERSPSAMMHECEICDQELRHHERLIVRAAWSADMPGWLQGVLVIACGPDALVPDPAADVAERQG